MDQVAIYSDTGKKPVDTTAQQDEIKRRLKELQDHQGER